jgi:hypothetical protein
MSWISELGIYPDLNMHTNPAHWGVLLSNCKNIPAVKENMLVWFTFELGPD